MFRDSLLKKANSLGFFGVVVVLMAWAAACNDSSASKPAKLSKPDSVWTTVLYEFDWQKNDYRITTARRIVKDSVAMVYDTLSGGEIRGTSKMRRDTLYYVPIQSPLKDSTGKILRTKDGLSDSTTTVWPQLPNNKLLQDYSKSYQ